MEELEELAQIKQLVEGFTKIEDISAKNQRMDYVIARSLFFYIASKTTKHSDSRIGRYVGKDHASVNNARKKLDGYMKNYPGYLEIFNRIKGLKYKINLKDQTERIIQLEAKIFDLERKVEEKIPQVVPPTHKPLLDKILKVPHYHVENVNMRLEPIIKMLEKPSRYNYLPKD